MELLRVEIDGDKLAHVAFTAVHPDDLGKEACWQNGELEIRASLNNETLSLNVNYKSESVLVFVGKIAAPATFTHKLEDYRKLTLAIQ